LRDRIHDLRDEARRTAEAADRSAASAFASIQGLTHRLNFYAEIVQANDSNILEKLWGGIKVAGEAVGGFVYGVGESLVDAVVGTVDAILNLDDTIAGLLYTVTHLGEVMDSIWTSITESWERDVVNGDVFSAAKWFGYAIGTVATSILGTKGVDKGVKLAKTANTGRTATNVANRVDLPEFAGENGLLDHDFYAEAFSSRQFTQDNLKSMGLNSFEADLDGVLAKHNLTRAEFDQLRNHSLTHPGGLTSAQQQVLRDIRSQVEITPLTVMQKVIPYKDVFKYTSGMYTGLRGFVARTQDVIDLETPVDVIEGLRLDYMNPNNPGKITYDRTSPFIDHNGEFLNEPIAMIRFTAGDVMNLTPPFEFRNIDKLIRDWPFTGTGFSGSKEHVVPEFVVGETVSLPPGTEIYIKQSDGTETFHARYVGDGEWVGP